MYANTSLDLCHKIIDVNGCSLGNVEKLGIEGVFRNHHGLMLRAFSMLVEEWYSYSGKDTKYFRGLSTCQIFRPLKYVS